MMSSVLLALSVAVAAQAAHTPRPVTAVASVDLERYLGTWFEIARYPAWFQRKCVGHVTATYATRADGRLDVTNTCRTADGTSTARGIARIADTRSNARLKVRFAPAALSFLPFVWGDYWIIGLAPDYSWAVVGTPDRKYLWILARTATLDDESYRAALARAAANGFDTTRLVRTPQ
jgi:apolipoprotein D and lipocalin family protein